MLRLCTRARPSVTSSLLLLVLCSLPLTGCSDTAGTSSQLGNHGDPPNNDHGIPHSNGHGHLHDVSNNTRGHSAQEMEFFLHKLFDKYGENGRMSFEGFEHLLQSLGIGNVVIVDHDIGAHHSNGSFVSFHSSHNHSVTLTEAANEHLDGGNPSNHSEEQHGLDADQGHHTEDDQGHHTEDDLDHESSGHEHIEDSTRSHQGHRAEQLTELHHDDLDLLHSSGAGEHRHRQHNRTSGARHHARHRQRSKNRNNKKKPHKNEIVMVTSPPDVRESTMTSEGGDMMSRSRHVREVSRDDVDIERHGDGDDHSAHTEEAEEHSGRGRPNTTCMTAASILHAFHVKYEEGIDQAMFLSLCPAIVHQIDRHACSGHHDDHDDDHDAHDHGVTADQATSPNRSADPKVWGYAVAAVTVISLVGLLSVAMVPILQKAFYHHLIQFLIALAVGSLTGDAMLHLIPHSLGGGHDHEDGGEVNPLAADNPVWKGMVVLAGVYFFLLMERGMAGIQQWKTNRRKRKETGEVKLRKKPTDKPRQQSWRFSAIGAKLSDYDKVAFSSEDMRKMSKKEAQFMEETFNETTEFTELDVLNNGHSHNEGQGQSHSEGQGHSKDQSEVQGHSKGHGHSHGGGEVPGSVAAIAWMVIMGDGLHNFSDGLAIGAGFANSLTGGLSTSVAVFCHELPHELGDFAVLLASGMTVKQALFYNIVSSVLCFIGMAIGVAVGNFGSASLWIFAMTAGTFIYISLVDMLPELHTDTASTTASKLCMVLLQILGISIGIGVMLVIALFEHKIKIEVKDAGQ